ncbi:MAG: hypothetical protein ACJ0RQ_07400 [Candidatus Azotimanducaceae bacterium]
MKLVTFSESSLTRVGILNEHEIIDLSQVAPSLPKDMLSLLQLGDAGMQAAAQHISAAPHFGLANVTVEAPIARPLNPSFSDPLANF